MKANSIIKRELSLLLAVVILFSCWVFTAPKAAAATAGSYTLRVDAVSSNQGDCSGMRIYVWYKTNNGTASSGTKDTMYSRSDSFTWDGSGNDDQSKTYSGFPYKVQYEVDKKGGIYSWGSVAGSCDIYIEGVKVGSTNSIDASSGTQTMTWEIGSTNSNYPKANYITSFGLASGQTATLTNPTGNNTVTKSISMGTVRDQYGVNWYQDPSAYVVSGAGYSVSGSTVTIGSGALATASNWKTTGTIGVKAGSTVLKTEKNGSTNATVTFTGTNPTYTTTWQWHNNGDSSTTWSGSTTKTGVYYNENPSAPSAATTTTKYYDANKHYSGGYYDTSAITGAATFNMKYSTSAAHSYTYSKIEGNDTNHTASCACGYNKAVPHDYGTGDIYTNLGDGTHKRTCKTSGCGYVDIDSHTWGAWQIIPEGQEANYGNHDRMAKHYRVCTAPGCGAKDYDNHTWVAQTIQAPTCTTDGHTPYKCSQCQLTTVDLNTDGDGIEDFQPMLGHKFQYDPSGEKTDTKHTEACSRCDATRMVDHPGYGDWYSVDGTYHAHNCTVCEKQIQFKHEGNWSGWQHEVPVAEDTNPVRQAVRTTLTNAEYDHDAQCFNYCSICAQVKYQNHTETSKITTPATCIEKGVTTYTCSDCGNARTDANIPMLEHTWVQHVVDPEDSSQGNNGFVYFSCPNGCGQYKFGVYDNTEKKYKETGTAVNTVEEAKTNAPKTPAPYFNDASSEAAFYGNPYYAQRPASFKKMSDSEMGKQTVRFAGSVKIPAGIGYGNDDDESVDDNNRIVDFGFVYTQTQYITSASDMVIGGENIAKMSVRENNSQKDAKGKPVFDENGMSVLIDDNINHWSGCTVQTISTGEHYITFNLVINIKAKNWNMEYAGRPYIIYNYNGIDYTVYDSGVSSGEDDEGKIRIPYFHRSINELADSIMKFDQYFDPNGTVIDSEGYEMSVEEFIYSYYVEPGVDFETFSQMAQGYIDDKAYVKDHIIAHCNGDADFTNKAAVKEDLLKDESKWLYSDQAEELLNTEIRGLFGA